MSVMPFGNPGAVPRVPVDCVDKTASRTRGGPRPQRGKIVRRDYMKRDMTLV
jgi:hypothetical protein